MNYRPKNNYNFEPSSRYSWRRRFFVVGLIIVTLGLLSLTFFQSALFTVATPFWRMENYLLEKFADNFSLLRAKQTLVVANRNLAEENKRLNYYMIVNDFLKQENEELKSLVGRPSGKVESILAYVLVKPTKSPYDILIVDVGENFGLKKGDLVSADGSLIIGEIAEVYSNSAKVELYSTPNKVLTVLVGPNSIQTDATGLGDGNFFIKLPKETEIKEGDSIIFPSISTDIFGIVEKVEVNSTNTFQNIYFKNPINMAELRFVNILKNKRSVI